jgi:cystathionine beta-synthase
MIQEDVTCTIGRTPLVRLQRVVPAGCAEVAAKLEYFAPGGSVKDRAALAMILDAETRGVLGGANATIVEPSAGNTGVGLAIVCAVRGYRCIVVVPESTSVDKLRVLAALGAEIVIARADVEASEPEGTIGKAEALAKELGAFMPDQFENPANPSAHYDTTGPEILADAAGQVDAFVSCVGSGGTLGGAARYLRERAPGVAIVGAAPDKDSRLGPHGTLVEGVLDDLTSCSQPIAPDRVITVSDRDALAMTLRLAREEAVLAGGSAGIAVHAAIEIARELGSGKRVVVVVPDTGRNYLSTYFNEEWRRTNGL